MDWFERITGFREGPYEETQSRLSLREGRLSSEVAEREYAVGRLDLLSLEELRSRSRDMGSPAPTTFSIVEGDVRQLHSDPAYEGALFQVASQFNLLEMVGPDVTPEAGVTRYRHDRTQGPACAMAAGAGTIYRNYLVPVGGRTGQTARTQIDAAADLQRTLAARLDVDPSFLWDMRNGYALPDRETLRTIGSHLSQAPDADIDALRGQLRVGLHSDVEVTEPAAPHGTLVSQVYCSAMPVFYSGIGQVDWTELASLVLEAAYEATLRAGVLNAARGASNIVLLTRLGGGAFGNDDDWIDAAILRALRLVADQGLDVRLVSFDPPSQRLRDLVEAFS